MEDFGLEHGARGKVDFSPIFPEDLWSHLSVCIEQDMIIFLQKFRVHHHALGTPCHLPQTPDSLPLTEVEVEPVNPVNSAQLHSY